MTAYPINSWLVKNKLKHGCMTLAEKDSAMPEMQHVSSEHDHMNHSAHEAMHHDGPMSKMKHHHHANHEMPTLSMQKAVLIICVTFIGLILASWATSVFLAPISF